MKREHVRKGVVGLVVIASLLAFATFVPVRAQELPPESPLTIHRFKVITGDQFIELRNHTDEDITMDGVQIVYYNNHDIASATTNRLISLSGVIPAGGSYLINDSTQILCYQTAIASASLGFATGSGRVMLTRLKTTGDGANPLGFEVLDYAAWYRGTATPPEGVIKFPATSQDTVFALRSWADSPEHVAGGGEWLVARPGTGLNEDGCGYYIEGSTDTVPEEYVDYQFAPLTGLPPVRYATATTTTSGTSKINRNIGKMAPIINEVLPNPASPQLDAEDEFIELYNPNDSTFDLSGFKLAFGSTNPRRFTFPEGTVMQPEEFKIFTSGGTSISLANTRGQVWLLDPNENIIGQTEAYGSAKDGQAWALDTNTGKWVWTLQPTPGEMNVLTGIPATGTGATARAVLGIDTSATGTAAGAANTTGTLADKTPVHPAVLAVVGIGALAYAVYEYRHDISNKLFQLRRHREHRRALRQKVPGR